MLRFRVSYLLAVILSVGISSCGKESTAPASVSLVASPTQLSLTDSTTTASVYLTANASGGRLDWQLANAPNWITVTPTEGTIHDDVAEVSVSSPDLASMEPGELQPRVPWRRAERLKLQLERDGFAEGRPVEVAKSLDRIAFTLENRTADAHRTELSLSIP